MGKKSRDLGLDSSPHKSPHCRASSLCPQINLPRLPAGTEGPSDPTLFSRLGVRNGVLTGAQACSSGQRAAEPRARAPRGKRSGKVNDPVPECSPPALSQGAKPDIHALSFHMNIFDRRLADFRGDCKLLSDSFQCKQ